MRVVVAADQAVPTCPNGFPTPVHGVFDPFALITRDRAGGVP